MSESDTTTTYSKERGHQVEGKVALVSGGGTGIGLAIAQTLVIEGARVVITGRRREVLQGACSRLGPHALWRQGDMNDADALSLLVQDVEREVGALDILVNNAGTYLKKPIFEITDSEFSSVLQTNLSGLFSLSREVGHRMTERGKGVILNVASMAGVYGIPRVAAYSASKAGVIGLTRALAVELGSRGVRVNSLSPGFIYSEMSARALDADPERKQRVMSRTPLGRMGTPAEVSYAALFLCSDAASFITGINLCVDGGNSIGF